MILLPEMDELTSVNTAQKMKFSIKDFFSKCDQMENFIFCAVKFSCLKKPVHFESLTQ